MNILIISNLFPPHNIGGYEIACNSTIKLLIEAGHTCYVITSDFKLKNNLSEEVFDFQVYRNLVLHDAWGTDYKLHSVQNTSKHNKKVIEEFLDKNKIDIIYYWNIYGLTPSVLKIAQKYGVKSLMHLMDESIKAYQINTFRFIKKFLFYGKYDYVNLAKVIESYIFISNYLKDSFCFLKKNKAITIHPFVDLPEGFNSKSSYGIKNKTFRGVFIGQIEKHKGVILLAEAIKKLNKDKLINLQFDFYGRSTSGLDKEIIQNYSNYITVKNGISRQEILNSLRNYDFAVFPSLWDEPFGIAQIELMAAGLPVITSAMGGSKEVCSEGDHIFFDKNEPEDLSKKILWLYDNYDKIGTKIGIRASQKISCEHSKKNYLNKLMNFLTDI